MAKSKYMVLFTKQSMDPDDKSVKIGEDMVFGYLNHNDGWIFDSAAEAHKEAIKNDYEPEIDFYVVRVLAPRNGSK